MVFFVKQKRPFSIPSQVKAATEEAKFLEKIANGYADVNSNDEATKRASESIDVTDYNLADKTSKIVVPVHKMLMKIMLLVKLPNIMNVPKVFVEGIATEEDASEAKGVAIPEVVVSE